MYGFTKIISQDDKNNEHLGELYLCTYRTVNEPKSLKKLNIGPVEGIKTTFEGGIICCMSIKPKDYGPYEYFKINTKLLNPNLKSNPERDLERKKANDLVKVIDVDDLDTSDISRYFFEAADFIDNKRKKKQNVVVHGKKGNSRAVAIICAYFVIKLGFDVKESLDFIKTRNHHADPNNGFKMQLEELQRFKNIKFK